MKQALELLVRSFAETNPEGAARALEGLEPEQAAQVLDELPAGVTGPVIERLTPHAAGTILGRMGPERTHQLLAAITAKQAAAVLQHLEAAHREAVLAHLPEVEASRLRALVQYPPETAGGMMEPQVASLAIDLTVQEAIAALRRMPEETLYYLYVTDRDGRLLGVLTMRRLLLAGPQEPIERLVQRQIVTVPATMDREEVAALMRQRRLLALPVVDGEGRLLGVVKHDEVLDTVQEEAFEDLQKMVGAGGDESISSPLAMVSRRRLPWLCVNLLTAFAAAAVISLFEPLFAQITALAVLLPIVSALGGNGGAQTLAVVMRGLALREIMPGAVRWLLYKEVLAGALNGLVVAVLAGLLVLAWSRNGGLALVIGLAMVVNMVTAGLAGAAVPLALKALGRDPAQSSQIFLTTITDIVGFTSFLGFATLFLALLT
ncbi:MAG: magnesium transporter [Gemmataceae bacterium]|nr:magnesium transporter [Gemmataceae bacterium]